MKWNVLTNIYVRPKPTVIHTFNPSWYIEVTFIFFGGVTDQSKLRGMCSLYNDKVLSCVLKARFSKIKFTDSTVFIYQDILQQWIYHQTLSSQVINSKELN